MRKYSLFALVHGLALLVAGLGVASTAQVSKYDCCYPGSPCCFVGSPCCEGNAADCCYPGSPCCFVGSPCCEGASTTANSPTTTAGCCGQAADAPGTGTCCGTAGCCAR
jgi:hypothetical protein